MYSPTHPCRTDGWSGYGRLQKEFGELLQEKSGSKGQNFALYHFALQIRPKMRRYFPRRRDETFAGRSEEVVASAGRRTGRPPRRSNAEKASSSRPFGEQAGTVLPSGIGWICTANWYYSTGLSWALRVSCVAHTTAPLTYKLTWMDTVPDPIGAL